jgi:hypothetical protein
VKGSGKHILRTTFGHLLPTTVMTRSKKGFEVPLLDLLRGPMAGFIDATVTPDLVRSAGLDWTAVQGSGEAAPLPFSRHFAGNRTRFARLLIVVENPR